MFVLLNYIARDIPFLHCTLRGARNYEPYITRIFVPLVIVMFVTTFVFYFPANRLSDRLTYVVTNMLTVVAFFFVMSSSLPQIPYLTLIDKYMNAALVYIVLVGIICVILNAYGYEDTQEENTLFYVLVIFLGVAHVGLAILCRYRRYIEFNKMFINRHQVEILEEHLWSSAICGVTEEPEDEFLVHTYISDIDKQDGIYSKDEEKRQTYTGTLRKYFQPEETAGWLVEKKGKIDKYIPDKPCVISKNKVAAINASIGLSRKKNQTIPLMSKYAD